MTITAAPSSKSGRFNSEQSSGSVAIVGLGYVGLPTAIAMASAGRPVIGYDISPERVDAIRRLDVDLLPADITSLGAQLDNPGFRLTHDKASLRDADGIIVCVPTPIRPDFTPNLDILRSACDDVIESARKGQTIILTSTTYVGCTRDFLVAGLESKGLTPGDDIHIAFSPERIDPGVPSHRPEETPRVVGGLTPECAIAAQKALRGSAPALHVVSSLESSEMCKLLENTYRAVNIAMINEFARAASTFDVAIGEVIEAAATKPFGFQKFTPGPGVGGHCIPCDPHYLLWSLRVARLSSPVVEAAMKGIAERPLYVVRRVVDELHAQGIAPDAAKVHVYGVAYKPDVADFRESPAEVIIHELLARGIAVEYSDALIPEIHIGETTLKSMPSGMTEADVVLVHTMHSGLAPDRDQVRGRIVDATYRMEPTGNVVHV